MTPPMTSAVDAVRVLGTGAVAAGVDTVEAEEAEEEEEEEEDDDDSDEDEDDEEAGDGQFASPWLL